MLTFINRSAVWPRWWQLTLALVSTAFFGFCLGSHGLLLHDGNAFPQILSSALKVPLIVLSSGALAALVCALLGRRLLGGGSGRAVLAASLDAILATGLCLALLGVAVLVLLTLNNYSIVILFAYASFGLSGVVGALVLWRRLSLSSRGTPASGSAALAGLFFLCFGLAEAQIGWSTRPLVGWTGQSFAYVRRDKATLFDQLRCEIRNTINFGGIRFPGSNEASDTKAWPC